MLALRKAGPADSEFAYRTRATAFGPYVAMVEGWDEDRERRRHLERFAAQDFWIVSFDGVDVGVMATVVAPDCVKVNQLFLVPEYQGRDLGRQCMRVVMHEAQGLELPVRLRVLKVNPRARVFYERLGFARTGETATHDLMEWRP
jgi:GNAT superfamily N-acetyltransferase